MKRVWFFGFPLAVVLLLAFRVWQENRDFQKQQGVFPSPQKGIFQGYLTEEPDVLFQHQKGSHDTGRAGGFYQPPVREARAMCIFYAQKDEPLTEVATSATAPIGAPPRNDSYKMLTPIKVRVTFRLSAQDPQPVLNYGDSVEIQGKIQAPPSALNPGQFDYARYLGTKGVAYVMYVAPGKWKKVEGAPQGWTFIRWSCAMKRQVEDALYGFLPFPENALLDGLLLGERGPLPSDLVESFMVTGTLHILAVSGMMTAFIAGLLFLVLRVLQIPRKWAAGAALVGVVFFVFMTGADPPVCRAGLFSVLALTAVLFERKINGGVLLLATALCLAIPHPLVLEDLSFQISFLATAGLMVFSARLLERLSFLWKPAALLIASTLAAQISVWCLLIYYFNQLSLYSPLANLLIVPLALFATAAGLTAIAGSFIHPLLGNIFGAACGVSLKLLILLTDTIALLPGASRVVASPPGFWVGLFHLLFLALLLFFWPRRQPLEPSEDWKRKQTYYLKGRKIILGAWMVFILASALFFAADTFRPRPLRLTFLAVGHGSAVVVRPPRGGVFVFDGGKETKGPNRYHPVVAYLRHLGIQKVEGILDTHPDADHVGGLINLLSSYPVGSAVVSPQAKADSGVYQKFLEIVQSRGVSLLRLQAGDNLEGFGPVRVEILHPPKKYEPRLHADNNLSLVSLLSFGGRTALLPGDLEREGLEKLLKSHQPFPRVDWLMAPHHGRSSGQPSLCAEGFQPRFVVMSDGKDYPEARELYQRGAPGSVVFSTSQEGAIEVEMGEDGKGRYRSFKRGNWTNF